jgi:hypothetical protein
LLVLVVVSRLPLLDPLFRVPTQTPWKNRAPGMALAFGGREITKIPNNQLIVRGSGRINYNAHRQ